MADVKDLIKTAATSSRNFTAHQYVLGNKVTSLDFFTLGFRGQLSPPDQVSCRSRGLIMTGIISLWPGKSQRAAGVGVGCSPAPATSAPRSSAWHSPYWTVLIMSHCLTGPYTLPKQGRGLFSGILPCLAQHLAPNEHSRDDGITDGWTEGGRMGKRKQKEGTDLSSPRIGTP